MILYTVRCEFSPETDSSVASDWVRWLRDKHIQDVLNAGATDAELVLLDGDLLAFEVCYRFPCREAFDNYETEHAAALRDEGLSLFPLSLGLTYQRTVGESLAYQRHED
jgi:hypothetical protein